MKIITKKSVIFTALAVVLLATALVISCNAPLDGISDKEEPSKPGTGKVRLTINTRNASRTIMPASSELSGVKYLLVLEGDPGNLPAATTDFYATVPTTGQETSVSGIPSGRYLSAKVIAYKGTTLTNITGSGYATVAIGEAPTQTGINPGDGYEVNGTPEPLGEFTTVLYPPGTNATVNGSFVNNITPPSRISTTATDNTFIIYKSGTTTNAGGGTLLFGPQTAIDLPSGSYDVIYTIKDKETPKNVAYFYEILHVYQNLISTYAPTLNDDIFPAQANTGSGTITINGITDFPNISFTANLAGATGATITQNNSGWVVKINPSATIATLTYTASTGTFVGWKLLPTNTLLTTGNGITVIGNEITIDATQTNLFTGISGGGSTGLSDYLAVVVAITVDSVTYNVTLNKSIRVYFE